MRRSNLRDVLGSLFGRSRPRSEPREHRLAERPQNAAPGESPPMVGPIVSSGVVVHDFDVADQYPGAVRRTVAVIPLMHAGARRELVLNVFDARDVALTTLYLPIDLQTGRLFINLTYEGVLHFWNPRPHIADGRYTFRSDAAETITRRAVLVGGPVDGNYYHWMLNWLSRLAILKMLRPDILADPDVALLIDWRARASPYVEFLHAIGIGEDRAIWIDHGKDYRVSEVVMVSFGNQHVITPAVVDTLREMFSPMGRQAAPATRPRRLWISRQQLAPNRRRIHNMQALRPLLDAYGVQEVILEDLTIAEQIALFQGAEFIASVHGAGLTNIIFCAPDCRVLAFDGAIHIRFGAALIYQALAQACGLAYRSLRARRAPWPHGVERNVANFHNQDLIVPVDKLDAALHDMLGPANGSPRSVFVAD